jgi:uncharacterized protein (DUF885 family)
VAPEMSRRFRLKSTDISPGRQGLSYQIGKLKNLELRKRAQQQLGQRFDILAFHDEVLGGRSLPLDTRSARVDGLGSKPDSACR